MLVRYDGKQVVKGEKRKIQSFMRTHFFFSPRSSEIQEHGNAWTSSAVLVPYFVLFLHLLHYLSAPF